MVTSDVVGAATFEGVGAAAKAEDAATPTAVTEFEFNSDNDEDRASQQQ